MKKFLEKYFNLNPWYLYLLNVIIYLLVIFVESELIFTEAYYEKFLRPLFHSQEDYIKALNEASKVEMYNYLWVPVHVLVQTVLISLCLFVGFNALNHYLSWKNSIKVTLQSIVIFSINNLVVIILKALNVIGYNPVNVDDAYFFQSVGRLFIDKGFSDFIYEMLEKINCIEVLFCLVLSYSLTRFLHLRYTRTLLLTTGIYLLGTIIFICVTRFAAYLI